jgi:ribosomal protein S27E
MDKQAMPVDAGSGIKCPSCSHSIACFDTAHCAYFSCVNCGTYFTVLPHGEKKVLHRYETVEEEYRHVEPGRTAVLDGLSWAVQGYMIKSEGQSGGIFWREYMLYSATDGYATLVVYNGHWMIVRPVTGPEPVVNPRLHQSPATYEETEFGLYHIYRATTVFAGGAFDENIREQTPMCREYASRDRMLVFEQLNKGAAWYLGKYLYPAEIAKAFDLKLSGLPPRVGVGIIQPSPYGLRMKKINTIAMFFVALVGLTVLLQSLLKEEKVLLQADYSAVPDSAGASTYMPVITNSFRVNKQTGIGFRFSTELVNDWLDLSVSFINEGTGKAYDFGESIEYYSGNDGGESWSEGSRNGSTFLSSVPAGDYHLNIYPAANGSTVTFGVDVIAKSWIESNVILILLGILAWPIINFMLHRDFEKKRHADD